MERDRIVNAAATAGTSVEISVRDVGLVTLQLKGADTYQGVVTFQGKIMEGDEWVNVAGMDASDGTTKGATSTNPTNKLYYIPVRGLMYFRLSYTRTQGSISAWITKNVGSFSL